MEIWKDIKGYEGLYQVSNLGRVKSLQRYVTHNFGGKKIVRERILKQIINGSGYYLVCLHILGKQKNHHIHRLLSDHFIPNPDNKPQVNHIDGNKLNNNIKNLEWATSSENTQHAIDNGLLKSKGADNHKARLVLDLQTGIFYDTINHAYETGLINYTLKHFQNMLIGFRNNKTNFIAFYD